MTYDSYVVTNLFRSIYLYSTAQTLTAAYIIGGSPIAAQNIIAEFENDQWRKLGNNLWKGRFSHGSITVGTQTMIFGGVNYSDE